MSSRANSLLRAATRGALACATLFALCGPVPAAAAPSTQTPPGRQTVPRTAPLTLPTPQGPVPGRCAFVNDDAITQALGTSLHAVEAFSIPDLQSCAVDLPDADPVTIMHITATEQSLLEGLGPIGSSEPVNVTTEPADGFVYSAMFVRIPIDGRRC